VASADALHRRRGAIRLAVHQPSSRCAGHTLSAHAVAFVENDL
jgi:hypothetical protein